MICLFEWGPSIERKEVIQFSWILPQFSCADCMEYSRVEVWSDKEQNSASTLVFLTSVLSKINVYKTRIPNNLFFHLLLFIFKKGYVGRKNSS